MNQEQGADIEHLEDRVVELEKLVEELERVPDFEVVSVLDRAVALLAEVNAGIEARLIEAEDEAREVGDLLEKVDFSPFDAALEDLEQPSGSLGEG